jgi:hypothetical protein
MTVLFRPLQRLYPQPLVAGATGLLAGLALLASWHGGVAAPSLASLVLTLFLLVAVVASYQYPIHIRHRTKVNMSTVPLFLMATLLPAPLAALAAGLGVLGGELSAQKVTGAYLSDIVTHVGRRTLLVLLGAIVAHLPGSGDGHLGWLVAAALVLLAGDILTLPLALGPLLGERPLPLIVPIARDAVLVEGAQYLLALVGASAAERSLYTVLLLALPTGLVYHACKNAKEMHDSTRELLVSMADTVDLRDPYTGGHSRRVTEYCAQILTELQVTGPERELILSAARVHDIGKIAIPDAILNKPDRLDSEERALMETHPERGAEVLRRYKDFGRGVAIVRHHHESWDGEGYPHRLKGPEIPFGARVIAVADSYDAMTSDRPYRQGMPLQKAANILREGRGRQWDPQVVDALLRGLAAPSERPAAPLLRLVPLPETDQASA